MKSIRSLATTFILTFTSTALADIEFTAPSAWSTFRAGDVITATWEESGRPPRISSLVQYDLYLCSEGEDPGSHEELALLKKDAVFAQGNSASFIIDPDVGRNGENAYFLKMVSSGPSASAINYSDRFTLADMTSTFPSNLNSGPDSELIQDKDEGMHKRRVVVDPYTVPYPQQTGPTRYAPLAKKAGTTIATTSPTPQFPASPYTVATAFLPPATVVTTLSASETVSLTMIENTASPVPHP